MSFDKLGLIEHLHKALKTEGYAKPTPIQSQAIPVILKGKDILGCAQTGTGKTAAFALPILQLLHNAHNPEKERRIKALVLTPTRELAIQIGDSFKAYGTHTGLRHVVIYGGVAQASQTKALQKGVDILIATPGRLLDLINQRFVHLQHLKVFVLDEADRMLDMGFIADIRKIVAKIPTQRQTLMFSATMPSEIQTLAHSILNHPEKISVTPVASTVDTIQQYVYFVSKNDKRALLVHVLKDRSIMSALVFTRTKHAADRVVRELHRAGIHADAIHGNKSQGARQRALNNFKEKKTRVLVATDIAARGIDVEELSHVINYDIPNIPETYVHRIGRTGRAGLSGVALSFCDAEERVYIKEISRLINRHIPVIENHPFPISEVEKFRHQVFKGSRSFGSLKRGPNRARR